MAAANDERPKGFYARALSEADRAALEVAGQVEGLDQEIAMLRVQLREAIEGEPEDMKLMLHGMEILRRLVMARYGMSRKDAGEMTGFARETLRRLEERAGEEVRNA